MSPANDTKLKSWVDVPADSDFPIQNIPFGLFKTDRLSPRAGVAIGDQILDLVYLHENGFLNELGLAAGLFEQSSLNDFFALGRKRVGHVRERVSQLLRADQAILRDHASARAKALIPMKEASLLMPIRIGNYTDFYSSEEHATNVGSMFRDPKNALLPNWKHLPVGYHGRASSIVISGTPVFRPKGQVKAPDAALPEFTPTRKLDFELETAFITCSNSELGTAIPVGEAEQHIVGMVLFNDWSARDIQQWEYVPLGPFLAKNFVSTISPWIVTLDALEPYRTEGPIQDPAVLPYLASERKGNIDIQLEVLIQPAGAEPVTVCRTNFKYMYWNMAQQLAHHTVNGCNIQVGDLYASGTISGPSPGSFGSMLELTWNGQRPLAFPDGTERRFLEDGDTVIFRGFAVGHGVRIGFGTCSGTIQPSR
ncbi:MAG TPA: fumarylacetoacetase [Cyclobacteriaceae bacterium]|nr:fumarylacetoacetase [Cyclobacteriaceae bacterium]